MFNIDNLKQSVTLPTGFATVPIDNSKDFFSVEILRIYSQRKYLKTRTVKPEPENGEEQSEPEQARTVRALTAETGNARARQDIPNTALSIKVIGNPKIPHSFDQPRNLSRIFVFATSGRKHRDVLPETELRLTTENARHPG